MKRAQLMLAMRISGCPSRAAVSHSATISS